jgi:hypothetical protein
MSYNYIWRVKHGCKVSYTYIWRVKHGCKVSYKICDESCVDTRSSTSLFKAIDFPPTLSMIRTCLVYNNNKPVKNFKIQSIQIFFKWYVSLMFWPEYTDQVWILVTICFTVPIIKYKIWMLWILKFLTGLLLLRERGTRAKQFSDMQVPMYLLIIISDKNTISLVFTLNVYNILSTLNCHFPWQQYRNVIYRRIHRSSLNFGYYLFYGSHN